MLRIEIREQRVGDSYPYPLRTWCCQFMTRCAQSAGFQSNMWLNTTVQISRKSLNVWSVCALCRVAFGATQYQMEPNYEFIVTMQLLFFLLGPGKWFLFSCGKTQRTSARNVDPVTSTSWVPATPFLNDTEPLGKRAMVKSPMMVWLVLGDFTAICEWLPSMMLNQKPVTGAVQGIRRCQAPRLAAPGAALAESIEEGVDFQLP